MPSLDLLEEKTRKVPLGHPLVLLVQPLEGLLVVVGWRDGIVQSTQRFSQLHWWAVVAAQEHVLGGCLTHWGQVFWFNLTILGQVIGLGTWWEMKSVARYCQTDLTIFTSSTWGDARPIFSSTRMMLKSTDHCISSQLPYM